jgi:hypothetical protein
VEEIQGPAFLAYLLDAIRIAQQYFSQQIFKGHFFTRILFFLLLLNTENMALFLLHRSHEILVYFTELFGGDNFVCRTCLKFVLFGK